MTKTMMAQRKFEWATKPDTDENTEFVFTKTKQMIRPTQKDVI